MISCIQIWIFWKNCWCIKLQMRLHKWFKPLVFWKTDRDGGSASSQLFSALKFEEMQHRSLHIFLIFINCWFEYWHSHFFLQFLQVHTTLGCQINEYTRLFGTKETWRKKQTQRQTKVFNKNPPYSFIWPYLFNWHLRVPILYFSD